MTMADRNLTRPDELSPGLSFYRSPEGELFCEDIPLRDLARRFGTPLYVYSRAGIVERLEAYEKAFGEEPHQVCYAVKAASPAAFSSLSHVRARASTA